MNTALQHRQTRAVTPETAEQAELGKRVDAWTQALGQSDFPPAEVVSAAESPQPSQPTWLNLLTGRLVLRACPCGSNLDACKVCQLGPLCHCAHGHLRSAAVIESRFWLTVALIVGVVLYTLLSAQVHR